MFSVQNLRLIVAGPFVTGLLPIVGPLLVGWAVLGGLSTALARQQPADDSSDGPPDPIEVHRDDPRALTTPDGVRLAATFFPGTNGKNTVPIILLHDHLGSGSDFGSLAKYLQAQGHAVLVPDLRGHGDSTESIHSQTPLKPISSIRMVDADMETLKAFLWKKNNEGELNLEKLTIIGAEMGASVALNWTRGDWSRPPIGNVKQGQDVKALVLISPEWSTPGLPLRTAMSGRPITVILHDEQLRRALKNSAGLRLGMPAELDFRREVSVYLIVGRLDTRSYRDADRLNTMLKSFHPDPPEDQKREKQDLFFSRLDTKLQGAKLFGAGLNLERRIGLFIDLRVAKRPFPWVKRVSNPYSRGN